MINPGGHVSVIGAGTMGNGIAHVFAQNGFKVSIVDVSLTQLDKAVANISKNFGRSQKELPLKNRKKMRWLTFLFIAK